MSDQRDVWKFQERVPISGINLDVAYS